MVMNKKYSRASLEALMQKAGVISRELDAKLERMEALGEEVKADARDCASWATRCAGHAVKCARHENEMRVAGESTLQKMRRCWGWVLVVMLIVDVVMRCV